MLGVLFIRVPYYTGDLERDPNLENYPVVVTHRPLSSSFLRFIFRIL